jgi:hypothetical protein
MNDNNDVWPKITQREQMALRLFRNYVNVARAQELKSLPPVPQSSKTETAQEI